MNEEKLSKRIRIKFSSGCLRLDGKYYSTEYDQKLLDEVEFLEAEVKRLTEVKDEYCKVWLDESEKVKLLESRLAKVQTWLKSNRNCQVDKQDLDELEKVIKK